MALPRFLEREGLFVTSIVKSKGSKLSIPNLLQPIAVEMLFLSRSHCSVRSPIAARRAEGAGGLALGAAVGF